MPICLRGVKFMSFLLSSAMLLLFAGCSKFSSAPKNALSKYLDAFLYGKYEESYQYISGEDKAAKSLPEYLLEMAKQDSPLNQIFASNVSYKIRDITITEGKAKINVDITKPDVGKTFWNVLRTFLSSIFAEEQDKKEVEKMLVKELQNKDIPTITTTKTYHLIRETDSWKIFLDWKKKKRVSEVLKQAEQLEKQKKLYAAKDKYHKALELDAKAVEAFAKVKELDKKIKSFEEERVYYVKNIKAKNVRLGESTLGKVCVFGEIKNLGTLTLREVEITIYCLDKNGKPVFEKVRHVVSESLFRNDGPLRPNYGRKFGIDLDDAPSDWAGAIKVETTNIKFD